METMRHEGQEAPAEPAFAQTMRRFAKGETHYVIQDGNGEVALCGGEGPDPACATLTLFLFSTKARALAHAEDVLCVSARACELIEMNANDVNSLVERRIVDGVHIDPGSEDEFCMGLRIGMKPDGVPGLQIRLDP